ncbi:uncharacterized protein LOC121287166 isoform X2 [Carcharodon carcharias]|uniref:uncharacterized protein LOC121287166 isoform X2 n=1 Tax=Carcharodon carcharias TaxID=13397 RepID=UPI001B7E64D4|nr:uncharacterized protein LOC121287166 isoform X2 [Carcharodon carcharias]
MKLDSKRQFHLLKWIILGLLLIAVIVASLVIILMNTEPMKQLAECQAQLRNNTSLQEKYMETMADTQSSLKNCHNLSARQNEDILELGKRMKELELIKNNFSKKQEDLEAKAQTWQEQFHQCEMNMTTTNNHLKRTREELKACQSDRNACRHQLQHGQASTVHGHIGLIVLSVMSLKLLCS